MAHATRAWRPLHGSPWMLEYPHHHQMITKTHPIGDKRVSEKFKNFERLSADACQLKNGDVLTDKGPQGGQLGLPGVRT